MLKPLGKEQEHITSKRGNRYALIGYSTYSSDPRKRHESYPVYWNGLGGKSELYIALVGRTQYKAVPAPYNGFDVKTKIG